MIICLLAGLFYLSCDQFPQMNFFLISSGSGLVEFSWMNPCGKSQEAWTSFFEYNDTTVIFGIKGFCHGCQKSTVLPSAYSGHTVTDSLNSFTRIAAFQLKAGLNLKCTLSCFWMQQKKKKILFFLSADSQSRTPTT